jgi:UDP-N-acetylmuramoyl-tripeptide--D-alanyl-D-alanine ligase
MPLLEIMKLDLSEVQKALAAQISLENQSARKFPYDFSDIAVGGVSTDTRTLKPGDLFFALTGENFDGHRFIKEAFAKGAVAAVVNQNHNGNGNCLIKVKDTLRALGDLAAYYRSRYSILCTAITGSNGKTTTKELMTACYRTKYQTLSTIGNFNNLIGLPLTLFGLDDSYQAGVFEIGMNRPGQIKRLAQICQPQVGVFTNVAPVHLESMGTLEAVAAAKHELIESLPEEATVIINIDDKILAGWRKNIRQKTITYGIDNKADFHAESLTYYDNGGCSFEAAGYKYMMSLPGKHNIYNALAAIAAAISDGCDPRLLAEPLANFQPYHLRSEVFQNGGVTIINDCYNANPASMKMAISTLAEFPGSGRKIAVLADMLELGSDEKEYHRQIGECLTLNRIDALFAFGRLGEYYIEKFNGDFKMHFTDKKILLDELQRYLQPGDVVLIKGSRGMALEEISESLRGGN